eukprot:GILK01005495.1.p1 GENE.GILK01005495.1~~GILK01005495.1.p1  ORF type:complete len:370 (+),score=57.35 GILK01005495.1:43-1110(+)
MGQGESLPSSSSFPAEKSSLVYQTFQKYGLGEVKTHVLQDTGRNKTLPIKIYYPVLPLTSESTEKFPVIVFSHGSFASKDDYRVLSAYFASHGYIVIHPSHEDSILLSVSSWSGLSSTYDHLVGSSKHPRLKGMNRIWSRILNPKTWESRIQDIGLILDFISSKHIERESSLPAALTRHIDTENISMAGHSFGAHIAMVFAGALLRLNGELKSFRDQRVRAALLLSPPSSASMGMDVDTSFAHISCPIMVITGSLDQFGYDPRLPFEKCPPSPSPSFIDKYLVDVKGMDHDFGGISNYFTRFIGFINNPFHVALVQTSGLAFIDCHCKQEKRARDYLSSDALVQLGDGFVSFKTR